MSSTRKSPLLKDTKLKRNAICPDWPGYFLRCKNTVMINDKNQMALSGDVINNADFACKVIENQSSPGGGKTLNAVAKYGISIDSPFKNKFTKNHPSTK